MTYGKKWGYFPDERKVVAKSRFFYYIDYSVQSTGQSVKVDKVGRKMQISSRFTLAVHIFACVDTFKDDYKVTSDFIAGSTNVNPVIIRKILGQLKAAGLIRVARGTGGTSITKPLSEITFLDIYRAVECVEDNRLFHFHENPNAACPVGRNIHHVLDEKLDRVQKAMERELQSITLEDVKEDLASYLEQENNK